jgi:Ran GTPase-activating protein (RanGAP) involved in mRNA processing and transport
LACSYNLTALNIASNNLQENTEKIVSLTQTLQSCRGLQKLNLGDNNFTSEADSALQGLFAVLAKLPRLSKLDLSYSLTDYLQTAKHIEVLFKLIQTTTSLTTLKLEQGISCELQQQIQQQLTNKPSLRLKLRYA